MPFEENFWYFYRFDVACAALMQWTNYSIILMDAFVSKLIRSCVADNALGRAKKYIEVSGRPGPAQFHSPLYSRSRDLYNLTWSVESVPKLEEIRILYRKLMVSHIRPCAQAPVCL